MSSRKMIKNIGIYSIVSILQKSVGFFVLPITTVFLSPDDFGKISLVTSITALLSIFFSGCFPSSIGRFLGDYNDEPEKRRIFLGTLVTIIVCQTVLFTVLAIVFNKWLFIPYANAIPFYPYGVIGILISGFSVFYSILQVTLQTEQKGSKYGMVTTCFFAVNTGLMLGSLLIFNAGALGVLISTLTANVFMAVYFFLYYFPNVKLGMDLQILKRSVGYSIPLIPHSLAGWISGSMDRVILNNYRNVAVVGLYSIGTQYSVIMSTFVYSCNQAYVPWFYENMRQGEPGKKRIAYFAEQMIIVYSLAALFLSLFSKEILAIMVSESYHEAWRVAPILAFSLVYTGLYQFYGMTLFYNEKGTRYISIGTLTGAAFTVLINYALIPIMGASGAAIANLASSMALCTITYWLSRKIEPIHYNNWGMNVWIASMFVLSMIAFVDPSSVNTKFLLLKFVVFSIATGMVFFLKKEEIRCGYHLIKEMLKEKQQKKFDEVERKS